MGNTATSKNPLISKWSTILNILSGKTSVSENDIELMAESTGITISVLYDMLGLTSSSKTTSNYNPIDASSYTAATDNTNTAANIDLFEFDGPILIREASNPKRYTINPRYIERINLVAGTVSTYPVNEKDIANKKYVDDHNSSINAHPNGFDHHVNLHHYQLQNVLGVELVPQSATNHGGIIDFHYNGTTPDYTARIIELSPGVLTVRDSISVADTIMVDGLNVKKSIDKNTKNIKNMFAGATLPDSTNLDAYYTTGISRITNNINGTKPPLTSVAGFLQVMDIDHDDDTTSMKNYRRLRQIIYPDKSDESTPYTRVGTVDDLTGTVSWSEWAQMGGGSLRRVVINGTSSPKSVTCVNNVMYESFGNNTFQLPSPSNVPVGTRIGIEQFSGTASVSCGTYNQTLSADTPDSSYDSQPAANAISYIFECVLDSSGTTREWILDIDHNYAAAVTTMVDRIIDVEEALAANSAADEVLTSRVSGLEGVASSLRNKDAEHDSAIDTLEVADNNIHGEFINQIARQTKHLNYAVTTSGKMVLTTESPTQNIKNDPSQMKTWLANNPSTLFYYDLIISVMTTNGTVVLPSAGVPTGARVTVELYTNYTVTVSDGTNSESFTNNESDNALLVLDFEYTKTGSSSTGWTLLSLV